MESDENKQPPLTEFDPYESSYQEEIERAISFGGQGHDFYMRVKADLLLDLSRRWLAQDPGQLDFLDVGCGVGIACGMLVDKVGALHGVDVSSGVVRAATEKISGVTFNVYDGHRLPYPDNTFDVVYIICVIHHVPPGQWKAFLAELLRVSKPDGLVVVMEHNGLNPATRHVVNTCVFDKDAVLISAGKLCGIMQALGARVLEKRYFLFFPFQAAFFRRLDTFLGCIPMGAQYVVAARKKSSD